MTQLRQFFLTPHALPAWKDVPHWLAETPFAWAILGGLGLLMLRVLFVWSERREYPYEPAKLLTPAELSFFSALHACVPQGFHVIFKVRLADIIQVRQGVSSKRYMRAFNQIRSKHADFVICDARTFDVCVVVELDDSSHQKEHRRRRDVFFNEALSAAGVPVLRVKAQRNYSPATLKQQVHRAMQRGV